MNARIVALAIALASAPLAASAQAVTAVPPPPIGPGPNLPIAAPPGRSYVLHDAFRAVTRAQSAQPASPQANNAAALYDVARAKYTLGDRFGAEREAALARGAAEIGPGVTIPVLQSTIGRSQGVVPHDVRPGLPSLDVKGKPLPNMPIYLTAPSSDEQKRPAVKTSTNVCDSLPQGPIHLECLSAMYPPK